MLFQLIFSWNLPYLILSGIVGYVVYFYAKIALDRARGRRAPGPWGLPYIGALLSMETEFHKALTKLGQIYGPVYSIDLGVQSSWVIEDADILKELFKKPELNGRVHDASVANWIAAGWGLFFIQDNKRWKLSRKNAVKALSLFSTAKNSKLSASVASATDGFKKLLLEKEGEPHCYRDDIFGVTNAVMMQLVFGREGDQQDPEQQMTVKYVSGLLNEMEGLMMLNPLPFLTPFYKGKLAEQKTGVDKFTNYMLNMIKAHEFDGEVSTIADAIKKSSAQITDEELAESEMTQDQQLLVALDLYVAGMFDTAENTQWFLVLLAAHPEIQERVYSEVQELTGGSRVVESADQSSLIYSYAALLESLRYACTAPVGMPHATTAEVAIREWVIPAGTQVVPNTWVINFNPKVFPEPRKYKPERFIKDGAIDPTVINNTMLFGLGGRRCIGEAFAKQEIFVVVMNILQDFRVELDPDTPGDPLEHTFKFTLQPGPHKLIFRRR